MHASVRMPYHPWHSTVCQSPSLAPQAVLKDPEDDTRMSLIFANQAEGDMLLAEQLDAWATEHPDRLKVHHILSRASDSWKGSRGRCTDSLFKEHLYPSGERSLALLCGPQPMIEQCCIPHLNSLGFAKDHIVVF